MKNSSGKVRCAVCKKKYIYYLRVNNYKGKNKSCVSMQVSKAHSFSNLFLKRKPVVDFHFAFARNVDFSFIVIIHVVLYIGVLI